MAEQDQEKTAFATPNGLSNSANRVSALYQCTCLFYEGYAPYLKGFTLARLSDLVYLDDIINFGRTLLEHKERLSLVLSRLTEAGLKINPKECKLLQEQVVVLGLVVSWESISTHPEKVRAIKEFASAG